MNASNSMAHQEEPAPRHGTFVRGAVVFDWREGGSSIVVKYEGGSTFSTVAVGTLTANCANAVVVVLNKLVRMGFRQMRFFHDWRALVGYEPRARHALTSSRMDAPPGSTESIHVLVQSALLTLGLAASAFALRPVGVEMYIHSEVTSFDAARRLSV